MTLKYAISRCICSQNRLASSGKLSLLTPCTEWICPRLPRPLIFLIRSSVVLDHHDPLTVVTGHCELPFWMPNETSLHTKVSLQYVPPPMSTPSQGLLGMACMLLEKKNILAHRFNLSIYTKIHHPKFYIFASTAVFTALLVASRDVQPITEVLYTFGESLVSFSSSPIHFIRVYNLTSAQSSSRHETKVYDHPYLSCEQQFLQTNQMLLEIKRLRLKARGKFLQIPQSVVKTVKSND